MNTIQPLSTKVDRSGSGQDGLLPAQRLNWVDRTVSFFNPNHGVRRMISREALHRFGYNDVIERRSKAPPLRGTETWAANRDRLKMMADARDAAMYDWIGGVLAKIVLYVCGQLHCASATGDEMVDQAYDEYFHNWCGDEPNEEDGSTKCDFSGRHRFLKQVQIAFLAFLVDGDYGFLEIAPGFDQITGEISSNYCLQGIEADRIGSPIEVTTQENYIGGVGLDPDSQRIAFYRIFHRTRTGMWTNPREVLPSEFIHVFDPDRSDEYRGRTKLLRLLNDLRDLRETIEGEKMAIKTQAQWAALIACKDPFNSQGASAWENKTPEGTPTQEARWGQILRMAEGESMSMMTPSARPTGAFMNFWDTLIRKMAVSLNMSYGLLWNLTTLGGVTARIDVQSSHRQIEYWQNNVLAARILNRVRRKALAEGIALQLVPPHPNWKKCDWHFGPWIVTDAAYEMETDIAGVNSGLLKIPAIAAKHGNTTREVLEANAAVANQALRVGAEQELPVEVFLPGLFPNITQQKANYLTPTPTPPPEAGSIDAIGDKGVGKLFDYLKEVGEGIIDRESAITTLVTVFGFDKKTAEAIVPDEPTPAQIAARNPAPAAPGKQVTNAKPADKKKATKK